MQEKTLIGVKKSENKRLASNVKCKHFTQLVGKCPEPSKRFLPFGSPLFKPLSRLPVVPAERKKIKT